MGFPLAGLRFDRDTHTTKVDTVESISMDDIRIMASDLAAQRLHVLSSRIDDHNNAHENSGLGHMKRVLKKLFPVFNRV